MFLRPVITSGWGRFKGMATLQRIILSLPIGKANAVKVPDFERAIGNQPSGTNNDQTRREVKDAIISNRIPIGSSPQRGYWLIDSDVECREIVDRINATIRDYEAKRYAIISGWRRRKVSKVSGNPWPK
jgi:hypothetical protein